MKTKQLFTAILFCCTFALNATVITVSNNPITAGQYTNLQTAINAAANGDTIYVTGSNTSYGNITIGIQLTIIGAGYNVTGTQYNLPSTIAGITLSPLASGTNLLGLYNSGSTISSSGVTNININRCSTGSIYIADSNWVVENNIVEAIYYSPVNGDSTIKTIIRNNFIHEQVSGYSTLVGGSMTVNASGLIIDHNIMEQPVISMQNAIITNNVFFNAGESTNGNSASINYNTFNNNITINSSSDVLPFGTNTGGGNFNNVDSTNLFVGNMSASQSFPTLCTLNWQLKITSVGHNAATDGTDIGMYGGSSPMPNLTGATAVIPQMTLMNINNAFIPVNGPLNVNFKARIQN